jgi:SP family facilitated glucose transporter-like MFS transporter 1
MVAIFYYSTDFFKSAGIEASQAQYATIGVGAIMVLMTIITIPLMDRAGRRSLHLVSPTDFSFI